VASPRKPLCNAHTVRSVAVTNATCRVHVIGSPIASSHKLELYIYVTDIISVCPSARRQRVSLVAWRSCQNVMYISNILWPVARLTNGVVGLLSSYRHPSSFCFVTQNWSVRGLKQDTMRSNPKCCGRLLYLDVH